MKNTNRHPLHPILAFFCFILLINLPGPDFTQVYLDSTASVSARVEYLLSRMTLNEKFGRHQGLMHFVFSKQDADRLIRQAYASSSTIIYDGTIKPSYPKLPVILSGKNMIF